ncbi:portal protein [Rhodococcus phage Trina]|uniref:Portal protein n=1 Tax=Rhodococcus phage Trina TaxID=2027905 RepID=A0A2D0ZWK4_9CAUD|nr:portal protein [Rhodococcus phage Trina]ASZ74883.1 portal protein [Rhodococcus phage Trina]
MDSQQGRRVVENPTTDIFSKELSPEVVPDSKVLKKLLVNAAKTAGSKQYVPEGPMSVYNAVDCIEPSYNLDYLAQLYDISDVHASAVDAKIDNIVGLGYYFDYTRKADKLRQKAALKGEDKRDALEEKMTDAKDILEKIADEFNQQDEFDETLEKFLKDRFATGNGYIEVGRTVEGKIGYVGHIPASTIRVRRLRDGFVQFINGKAIFFRNFGDKTTKDPFGLDNRPNEIIHYKKFSPTDNYYGVPEIVSALNSIAGIKYATKYNIDYFENLAVPRYIIVTKGMNVDAAAKKDLLRFFEVETKGTWHRSIVVPLPNANAEIEFEPVETGKQDSSFDEYIKLNQGNILLRHRVPANRLGKSDGTSLAASRDADKIFKESVCRPEQRIIEKKVNKIFSELTDMFNFKLNEYSLTDEDQKSAIYERYLRYGVAVPDEIREKLGWGPRSDGKGDEPVDSKALQESQQESAERMQQATLASAEKVAKSNAAAAAARPTATGSTPAKKAAPAKAPAKKASPAATARAEQKTSTTQGRVRDQNRTASTSPDKAGSPNTRNPKGAGTKVK